ncbi:hypothetical protein C2G38_2172380 [Gigaspora rosea]|uniref:Uncharacterized protein n=1 Tax=Gigaspora rosea TaxID=44941 RepID=A0A397VMI4_9GLOM|nr:hypothetical protein C2G38_2172380 [Gigaspora rosea]
MGSSLNHPQFPECSTSEAIPNYDSQQQLAPCIPQTIDDIVRPLDPSTSDTCIYDPPISEGSLSQTPHRCGPTASQRLNPQGFAEFLEALTLVSVRSDNPRTQLNLWRDYNRVRERFAELNEMDLYLKVLQKYADSIQLNINRFRRLGINDLDNRKNGKINTLLFISIALYKR